MPGGTYSKSVRIGNWCEEVMCEEEDIKDYVSKMEKNELLLQKSSGLKLRTLEKRQTTVSTDGYVHFGDKLMLICKGMEPLPRRPSYTMFPRPDLAMAINSKNPKKLLQSSEIEGPCVVTASPCLKPIMRNIFVLVSTDGTKVGEPVLYGQKCLIRTDYDAGGLFLQSDRKDMMNFARMSMNQDVSLVKEPTILAHWEILCREPRLRNEVAGYPVKANDTVVLRHSMTHNNLNLEEAHPLSSLYGREWEISCCRMLDSHKYELSTNHWVLRMLRELEADELKY